MAFIITSAAFLEKGAIPSKYTCEGSDISVPLEWSGVPVGTKSLALIVDDPDAPDPKASKMTWTHWILYNIPPTVASLLEGAGNGKNPEGVREGINDWNKTGYGGPCPPIGRHRYFHKLYALDIILPDLNLPRKAQLEKAMQNHILGLSEIIGTYQKTK
ncbi:MAG: YbhB/YbcL family Raf kinase inhibitor-like protein [Nitrospirae bacterium]|nr:YbhB/YbcL family Raf kinase inhibitor-like protein [Candidatus Troglogloeales bacterium]